jgi:uncharacterized protein (TIGR02444 family)
MAQMISLWTFACKLYNEPAVKNACLQLQDDNDVNVPLLLTACWLIASSAKISSAHATQLQVIASDWNDSCIQSLRVLRQSMKSRLSNQENNDDDMAAWALVREQVKAVELSAEQQLLQQMERYVQQQMLPISKTESDNSQSEVITFTSTFDNGVRWVDHAFTILAQCLPALIGALPQLSSKSPQARSAIANIILSIMPVGVPAASQMSYDDVLERISR